MHNSLRGQQNRMAVFLLTNLLFAAVAPEIYQLLPAAPGDILLAFLTGAVVLTLISPAYGRFLWFGAAFILYLAWQIILSNLAVARLVLQPNPKLDPGIVAIPLHIETGLEITALASAITLTPGTISIDLGRDAQNRRILYLHALVVNDPDELRASGARGFERMILRISHAVLR